MRDLDWKDVFCGDQQVVIDRLRIKAEQFRRDYRFKAADVYEAAAKALEAAAVSHRSYNV